MLSYQRIAWPHRGQKDRFGVETLVQAAMLVAISRSAEGPASSGKARGIR
jgi:hypothetical protein